MIPAIIENSIITQPFLRLASLSQTEILDTLRQSTAYRAIQNAGQAFTPLHKKFENATPLHRTLEILHGTSLIATLLIATFASTEIIAAAIIGSFVLLLLRALLKPMPFKPTIMDAWVAMFFLTAVISTAFSSYRTTSLTGLMKFLIFAMAYINFRALIGKNPKWLFRFLVTLVILGFAESLIGMYQYAHHIQPLATWQDPSLNPEDQLTRIFGTLQPSNPNLLAGFLIPCVAAGTGLILKNLAKGRWPLSLLIALFTLPTLGALVLTGSRGGYLAIAVMALMTFLYIGHVLWNDAELKNHHRLKAMWLLTVIGAAVLVVGALVAMPAIRTRFLSIFAMREDSSNSYRMNVWIRTIAMIKDNWLVGIGPGNDTFKQVYGLYMIPGYNALSAYSIFLEIWAEQGILGIIGFLVLLIIAKMRAIMTFYSNQPLENKIIVGALYTGIIGSVIYGIFDTIWYRPSVNILFWLFLAGLAVYSEPAIKEKPITGSK